MKFVCIYQHHIGEERFSVFFDSDVILPRGTGEWPEREAVFAELLNSFKTELVKIAKYFHRVGGVQMPASDREFWLGKKIVSIYAEDRGKAVFDFSNNPLVLE